MTRWIPLAILLCSLLAGLPSHAAAPALTGSWTGSWVRDNDALTVTIHFKRQNSGWMGDFDSDRLRVIGIPLSDVSVTLPRVRWKVVGDETTMNFEGELHGTRWPGNSRKRAPVASFDHSRIPREERRLVRLPGSPH